MPVPSPPTAVDLARRDAATRDVLIRVAANSPPQQLASAISHAVYDGKKVVMRAIGANAVNQAMKAAAIARGYVAPRGLDLTVRPHFTGATGDSGDELNALGFLVIVS